MPEEDFESKSHLTQHLTGRRFHFIRERSEINSAQELDFIFFKEYLARTLTPERTTPDVLKSLADVNKYRSAFGSFKFSATSLFEGRWTLILIAAITGVVIILYLMGYIRM